jgi:RNA polymerase sigma-70 factor (ECF subfamily)
MFPDEMSVGAEVRVADEQPGTLDEAEAALKLSFEELFDRYHGMVLRLVHRILADREEALDVTQEVFLTVYRKMNSFRGESSIKTWIYRIALNRASNRCRWWSRIRRCGTISLDQHLNRDGECSGSAAGRLRASDPSPEEHLLAQEEQEQIQRLLLRLPLHQRSAVIMRDIEGMSYVEIAAVQEVSCGTVKSRLARGREELRRLFEEAVG